MTHHDIPIVFANDHQGPVRKQAIGAFPDDACTHLPDAGLFVGNARVD